MTDEDIVLNSNTITNKRMALDATAATNGSTTLNLDKGADPGLITYAAAV
jgi:hypothetical protein